MSPRGRSSYIREQARSYDTFSRSSSIRERARSHDTFSRSSSIRERARSHDIFSRSGREFSVGASLLANILQITARQHPTRDSRQSL